MNTTKICKECKTEKLLNLFDIDMLNKSGLYKRNICKTCVSIYTKERKMNNKELINEQARKSYHTRTNSIEKSKNRKQIQYDQFKLRVEDKGWICLDTVDKYVNANTKLNIKCCIEHEWSVTPSAIQQGRWCPICNINICELITKHSIEYLFNVKFIKIRPEWLKNEEGNKLELDIYNENLKLAVEYNGIQHSVFIKHFHRTEDKFEKQIRDDKIKIAICEDKDIILIIVPHTIYPDDICQFIFDETIKHGFKPINNPVKINLNDIYINNTLDKKIKEYVKLKNGKIIEGVILNKKSKLLLECCKGHIWSTFVYNVYYEHWCPKCGKNTGKNSESLLKFYATEEGKESRKNAALKMVNTKNKIKLERETKCNFI